MREISSAGNGRYRAFAELCKDRHARDREGLVVIDGVKLCADAAAAGHRIRELWITEEAAEKYADRLAGFASSCGETYLLRGDAARRASELKAPQGVFAVVERPRTRELADLVRYRRVLGLCGLQSPENAAAAVRTAAALGYGAAVLTADCADIWSPRSIRAGARSNRAICVVDDMASAVRFMNESGTLTAAAALADGASEAQDLRAEDRLFLVIGNEGHGLPAEVTAACGCTVVIPMSGKVESLNANAAAAILMWELRERE